MEGFLHPISPSLKALFTSHIVNMEAIKDAMAWKIPIIFTSHIVNMED